MAIICIKLLLQVSPELKITHILYLGKVIAMYILKPFFEQLTWVEKIIYWSHVVTRQRRRTGVLIFMRIMPHHVWRNPEDGYSATSPHSVTTQKTMT
jgi:hypothetical protein